MRAWSNAHPAVRGLWLFLVLPAAVLGVIALRYPSFARIVTTILAPLLPVAAAVWSSRHDRSSTRGAQPSRRPRAILIVLIGLLLVALLLTLLYSHT
jgi:hypothetical protein